MSSQSTLGNNFLTLRSRSFNGELLLWCAAPEAGLAARTIRVVRGQERIQRQIRLPYSDYGAGLEIPCAFFVSSSEFEGLNSSATPALWPGSNDVSPHWRGPLHPPVHVHSFVIPEGTCALQRLRGAKHGYNRHCLKAQYQVVRIKAE